MISYNELIGIPFDADNINGKNCYEILRAVYMCNGIYVSDINIAECSCKDFTDKEVDLQVSKYWEKITRPEIICGVLMKSYGQRFANHIGVFIGKNRIIHTKRETGCIIESMLPKYKNKINGFYKFIG